MYHLRGVSEPIAIAALGDALTWRFGAQADQPATH
jgi:hypothetical protein